MIRLGFTRKVQYAETDIQAVRTALGRRSIVMVGLMGCGKSSVGRRLAAVLDLTFADADDEIETAAGRSIAEIFADHGEPYFRNGERRVIARLLRAGPQVMATGGGAFMDAVTRINVRNSGVSVWLKADLPVLMKRVMRRHNRPLLQTANPEQRMRELMEARYPVYEEADIIVESRDVPHDEMVARVLSRLARELVPQAGTVKP